MSWDNETELPVACYASTGIEYKKKIYLFGGISNHGLLKSHHFQKMDNFVKILN